MNTIQYSLGEHDYIELSNLLKLTDLVQSGGEAKICIQDGEVMRNGELETRRRKKLFAGDEIQFRDHCIIIEK